VAEDGDRSTPALLLRREGPAERRLDSQQWEEPGRHPRARDVLRLLDARQLEFPVLVRGQPLERPSGPPESLEIRSRERHLRHRQLRDPFEHHDEPSRVPIGKRSEEHAVDDAEDGGVRADPERQRQDHDEGETGRLGERPDGVAEVLGEGGHEGRLSETRARSTPACK